MKAILCFLLSVVFFSATAIAQDVTVKKVDTPITIDGAIDAVWENVAPNYVEYVVVESVDDEYDLYGEWKALWDDNNFYMLVEVTDDELYDDSEGVDEHDDGFDIMFDTDNGDEDNPDVIDNDDFMLMVEYSADGECPVGGNKWSFAVLETEGIEAICSDTDAGYIVEIAVPLENLDLFGGETIGFGFRINDDDDGSGRDGQIAWFIETASVWNVPSALADVELSTEGITGIEFDDLAAQIEEYQLAQNYPNPFNPSTQITYAIKKAGRVKLMVYNMLGHTVATLVDGIQTRGSHSVQFDAPDLSSGIYFYKLQAGSKIITRKMMLVK
jgi:hypothetical protein